MRSAAPLLVLALAVPAGAAVRPDASPTRTVPCDEIILPAGSPRGGGSRLVLDALSVPPAFIPQTVPTGDRPWAYWSKWGLVVRAGRGPVTVSVPRAWRSRAAITWGNSTGIVSTLRIARCPAQGSAWGNAYAGGFYLRARGACVPLIFRVGGRSATVRFGVGRRCP